MKLKTPYTTIGISAVLTVMAILVITYFGIGYKNNNPLLQNFLGNMARKTELISTMQANLFNSEQAEKSAVMADTDEASHDFAEQSRKAADKVDEKRAELRVLLERDHSETEMRLAQEFDNCWEELRKIDHSILEFSVQNTNIKAAHLSFIKGKECMDRFVMALQSLIHTGTPDGNDKRIIILSADALAAGLGVANLHAPHILEAQADKMDAIEAQIQQQAKIVGDSLTELGTLVPAENHSQVEEAKTAYAEFTAVTAEVIRLSRENTNIKSFELSLGKKRKIAVRCAELLTGLLEAVRDRQFKATR